MWPPWSMAFHGSRSFPLCVRLVRELHEKLMEGVRGQNAAPGQFRASQNWIGETRQHTGDSLLHSSSPW